MAEIKPNTFGETIKSSPRKSGGSGVAGAVGGALVSAMSKRKSLKNEQAMSDIRKSENEHLAGLHKDLNEQAHSHTMKKMRGQAAIGRKNLEHAASLGDVSEARVGESQFKFRKKAAAKPKPKK